MLEFLLILHSNPTQASTTAILRVDTEETARDRARAIAHHDGRAVELWRNQQMVARFLPPDWSD